MGPGSRQELLKTEVAPKGKICQAASCISGKSTKLSFASPKALSTTPCTSSSWPLKKYRVIEIKDRFCERDHLPCLLKLPNTSTYFQLFTAFTKLLPLQMEDQRDRGWDVLLQSLGVSFTDLQVEGFQVLAANLLKGCIPPNTCQHRDLVPTSHIGMKVYSEYLS